MPTTVASAFNQYASNLEITDRQVALVSARRDRAVSSIAKHLTLYDKSPSLLIGSYDRQTLTRYLFEGDVDVMVVLHYSRHNNWENSQGTDDVLNFFKQVLSSEFCGITSSKDRNCVTMHFPEFRLDVVPAFAYNDGTFYRIPDSVRRMWVPTNPIAFASGITRINQSMDGAFVPLIKMVKGWNRNVGWPIRSFHLECLMHGYYAHYNRAYTYSSMLKVFFDALPSMLGGPFSDPMMGDRVDTYLDNNSAPTRRQIAIRKAQSAADQAAKAYSYETSYPALSIGEWKKLFGEFFPT